MENDKMNKLQDKILEGLKKTFEEMIETKKKNKQKIDISVNGEIKVFIPQ